MDDFYAFKDEEYALREAIPKWSTFTQEYVDENVKKCVELWKRIEANTNLSPSLKDTLLQQLEHTKNAFHIKNTERITRETRAAEWATTKKTLEACASE
jgi:hypothetical protein